MEKHFSLNQPSILFKALTIISCLSSFITGESVIGINWGRQTSHRFIPSMVVDLLLQNNIRHLKLFSNSDNVLKAFAGSHITITGSLSNIGIESINSKENVTFFVQNRIIKYLKQNINIRYLHVGNEPFTPDSDNRTYYNAIEALRKIQQSLVEHKCDVISTIPHFTDVLKENITKPSEADFRPDLKAKMVEFVQVLKSSNAPFVMNLFPIYYVSQKNWDIEFSYIKNKSNFTIEDNGLLYRNVFEFVYDSFLTAMAKAGAPNLKLVVGQIGWPTDGFPGANTTNAERFFKEFLPYARSKKGTPLRPGISIDVFIHSLSDENMNKIDFGAFVRHWGIYRVDGKPKYRIDFTGQGREIYPTTAKGVISMPKRWCIFNGNKNNLTKLKEAFEMACREADCTSLAPGGSCSHLDFNQNVSYAFNKYYQAKEQSDVCDFGGLGTVVPDDPSVGTCVFPVEILAAEFPENNGVKPSSGERLHVFVGSTLFLPLFLMLWVVE